MMSFEVLIRDHGVGSEYGIRRDGSDVDAEVWLRDVLPMETESVRLRMELWAERTARFLVHAYLEKVREARG